MYDLDDLCVRFKVAKNAAKMAKSSLVILRRHVEWLDALYLLGTRAPYNTYFLPYLLTQLARAYKAGNISETVEDRTQVTINSLGLYNVVHWLSIAAKMYDLE